MGIERRRFFRKTFKVEVSVSSEHTFWTGFSMNISRGGLFVATKRKHKLGDIVEINFVPPGLRKAILVRGVVKWVRQADDFDDVSAGFGIEFLSLPAEIVEMIDTFITDQRAPLFYD